MKDTVFKIMNIFIPNQTILIHDIDPKRINKTIKVLRQKENLNYKKALKQNHSETQKALFKL